MVYLTGDNLPEDRVIDNSFLHFQNPRVGIVGGRPVPVNDPSQGFLAGMLMSFGISMTL